MLRSHLCAGHSSGSQCVCQATHTRNLLCTAYLGMSATQLTRSSRAVSSALPWVFIMLLNDSKAACTVRTFFTCTTAPLRLHSPMPSAVAMIAE